VITGIGVDMVTISRIAGVYERFGSRFARRFLHEKELEQFKNHSNQKQFLAKRFAIKEAAVKALGTGERNGVLLRDFYVEHTKLGKPLLRMDGVALTLCDEQGGTASHVSLSDEGDQVVAFVVFERE